MLADVSEIKVKIFASSTMDVSFDDLLAQTLKSSDKNNAMDTDHDPIEEEEQGIDYFGDYTINTVGQKEANDPLYNPHSAHSPKSRNKHKNANVIDYGFGQRLERSKYNESYEKRYRKVSEMTMDERENWEAIARRNKRRRLNQQKLQNENEIVIASNSETLMKPMDDDLVSSDSSSSSYDAIIFENSDKNVIDAEMEMIALDSSDDEQDEFDQNEKKKIEQSQIEKLVRIPKIRQQRSHLDLIKAVRRKYKECKKLPVLETFAKEQNITKKRAKRAILQVMRENNLGIDMLKREQPKNVNGGLKRQVDESDDESSENSEDAASKLSHLPPESGKYPFDSNVEKAMLRLLNHLKRFNSLFVEKRSAAICMDLATMIDKVSMRAYSNIGIDLRYDFEKMVQSFKECYASNANIVALCLKFLQFGLRDIVLSDSKLIERAKNKPMEWHLKQMMKQKKRSKKMSKKNGMLSSDPLDIEGFWKIPYRKIKYNGDQSKLETLKEFKFNSGTNVISKFGNYFTRKSRCQKLWNFPQLLPKEKRTAFRKKRKRS